MSTNCTFGDISRCELVVTLRRVSASLSMIGCLFIIFIIWLFKRTHSFTQRLILALSIAALANSITYLVGRLHDDGGTCNFEAFLLTWFEWSVLLWVVAITFNVFQLVKKVQQSPGELHNLSRFELLYHAVCWLLPAVIACLPFSGDRYGPAGAWCWIKNEYPEWRFAIWYGPLFALIIFMFLTNGYIFYTIRIKSKAWGGMYNPDNESRLTLLKEEVTPLLYYPLVYLFISLPALVTRIHNTIDHEPKYELTAILAFFSPLAGALNALVFGLDAETRQKLTLTDIKNAWQKRLTKKALIREYPSDTVESIPDQPDGYGTNDVVY